MKQQQNQKQKQKQGQGQKQKQGQKRKQKPPERSIWRLILRIMAIVFGLWLLLVIWGLLFAWRRLPCYQPAKQHVAVGQPLSNFDYGLLADSHARPYIVELETESGGAVLLYGAEHTQDPADPQLADIRERWDAFKPDVALVESRLGIMFPGLMDPVETFGEPGAVAALAKRDKVELYSWEPTEEQRIQALLEQPFSRRQIALSVILGPYFGNLRHGKPADPDAWIAEYVRKRGSLPGIEGEISTVAELNAAWDAEFPDGPDWRAVSDQYGLPGYLARVDGNMVRDEHLLQGLLDLAGQGRRVFVIAGSAHAVKLDAVLRSSLGLGTAAPEAALDDEALRSVQDNF